MLAHNSGLVLGNELKNAHGSGGGLGRFQAHVLAGGGASPAAFSDSGNNSPAASSNGN
jgi:hypothetical protein